MCEFCENITTETNYKTLEPYLIFENKCRYDEPAFHINVPTDEGVDYAIDDVKFCPYCGRKLMEV